jgi:hypothetical protein
LIGKVVSRFTGDESRAHAPMSQEQELPALFS